MTQIDVGMRSWIGRIYSTKMTIPPKAINKFKAITVKLPMTLFTELEQKNLKFVWKHRVYQMAQS